MGLYIAAAFASVGAMVVLVWIIHALDPPAALRPLLAIVALMMLPLEPLAFLLVRQPLVQAVIALMGTSDWVRLPLLLLAPLTEEPAKWLVLTLPPVRRALRGAPPAVPTTPEEKRANAVALAMAAGLGFGLGEIWFIAFALTQAPNHLDLPFWQYWGFALERIEVCFLHGAFAALVFVAASRGRGLPLAALAAIALHTLVNLPIHLSAVDAFSLGPARWLAIMSLWTPGLVMACGFAVRWVILRRRGAAMRP